MRPRKRTHDGAGGAAQGLSAGLIAQVLACCSQRARLAALRSCQEGRRAALSAASWPDVRLHAASLEAATHVFPDIGTSCASLAIDDVDDSMGRIPRALGAIADVGVRLTSLDVRGLGTTSWQPADIATIVASVRALPNLKTLRLVIRAFWSDSATTLDFGTEPMLANLVELDVSLGMRVYVADAMRSMTQLRDVTLRVHSSGASRALIVWCDARLDSRPNAQMR